MWRLPKLDNLLTAKEQEVADALGLAYNLFIKLPVLHDWDYHEFCEAIHRAQNIVLSRPVLRQENFIGTDSNADILLRNQNGQ